MSGKIEYDFKTLNPSEFECTFLMNTSNRMMNFLFMKSKNEMLEKKGVKVDGSPQSVTSFDVPDKFFNYLKTLLHKQRGFVESEVGVDKIVILTWRVMSARFTRKGSSWDIKIIMGGDYVDKR